MALCSSLNGEVPGEPSVTTIGSAKGGIKFEVDAQGLGGGATAPMDLQARFEAFRRARVAERKKREENDRRRKRDPHFNHALRASFVKRALSYIGAPYHRKYFPDLPEGTLFLDCCGIIRQALRDLEPDFGFRPLGGNQSYQLDTLPIALEREQLIPGDLIFWIGDYVNPDKKPQRLNCVHVEIYLGSHALCLDKLGLDIPELVGIDGGNATLGSRTAGHVQVHATYVKTSALYTVSALVFRSIDTWLNGTCEGHAFDWGRPALPGAAGKQTAKSIFCAEAEEDASDGEADECHGSGGVRTAANGGC